MTHVFISYAKIDTYDLALYLHETLNNTAGFTAWMDGTLEPGKSWARSIEAEIDRADFMIVLLSPDVNRSEEAGRPRSFVLNEIDYAQQIGKPIIPVMAQRTRQPIQIAGIQYIDLTVNEEVGFQRLMRRLGVAVESPEPPTDPMQLLTDQEVRRGLSPVWIGALVALSLFVVVGISLLNGIGASNEQPTPTTEDASTPDLTRTVEVLVAQFLGTNAAAETQIAATLTANFTPSVTPNATETAESLNISAATIAAERISTQQAQLTANAPTNTPEPPTSTATFTPTLSNDEFTATALVLTQTAEAVFEQTQQAVQIAAETAAAGTLAAQQTAAREATATAQAVLAATRNAARTATAAQEATATEARAATATAARASVQTAQANMEKTRNAAQTATAQVTPTLEPVTNNVQWKPVSVTLGEIEMVQVPPGCFEMGKKGAGGRQCFDKPFWISKTEITNAQYAKFVAGGGYKERTYWVSEGWIWKVVNEITLPTNYSGFRDNDQPRVNVSWYEAVAYSKWLTNELRAKDLIGRDYEIRLPTEAEWEFAARGPDVWLYPWGSLWLPSRLNALGKEDGFNEFTAPVGSYPSGASWVGALDMSGNAWEFTLSVYSDYPYIKSNRRNDVSQVANRVIRGGSFFSQPEFVRTVSRRGVKQYTRSKLYGFRIVLVPAQ